MNKVLDTDDGLIAIALEVYANYVKTNQGPINLQVRALELSTKFRNQAIQQDGIE